LLHFVAALAEPSNAEFSGFGEIVLTSVSSAVIGFLAAWAAQSGRTRGIEKDIEMLRDTQQRDRADHDKDMERIAKQVADACGEEREHHRDQSRRQLAMLDLQVDIARKLGVTSRLIPDAIQREEF
jgi:ABC-type nickel/cobalt efflux system permease component RcnA